MNLCIAESCLEPRLEGRSVCGECACDFLAGRFDIGWADDDDRFDMPTDGAAYASVFTGTRGSEIEIARFYRLPFEPDLVNANDRALHFIARMNNDVEVVNPERTR